MFTITNDKRRTYPTQQVAGNRKETDMDKLISDILADRELLKLIKERLKK